MRRATILFAGLCGLAFVLGQAGPAWSKDFKITKSRVEKACGGNMQGGGKNFGCTKCDGGLCRDYSCNGSGKGRQGCWETVIKRTGPKPGRQVDRGTRPHGDAVAGGRRRVPKGSPHPATVHVGGGHTFNGKPIQGANSVGPAKEDTQPPFDRHGGGRASNNRRH
jgi:hypothetical protein